MDSRLGGGQSLGKRLLNIRVVDAEGKTLSIEKTMLRTVLFSLPSLLNGLSLSVSRTPAFISGLISIVVVCLGGAIIYMLLFNRETKQGIHDIAVGSFVVNVGHEDMLQPKTIWSTHWIILAGLLLVLGVGGTIASEVISRSGTFVALLDDVRSVEALPGVQNAGVQKMWSSNGGGTTRQTLFVSVVWNGRSTDEEKLATLAAQTLLSKDPDALTYDTIRVAVTRGYDIGIASSWRSNTYSHSPQDWQ